MSQFPVSCKKNSLANTMQSRVLTENQSKEIKKHQNINHHIQGNLSSIKDTLQMLKEYEYLCIKKEDFLKAQETKHKIQFLQKQQKVIQRQRGVLKQQQNIENICRQSEQEVLMFQQYWHETITNFAEQLKEIQFNFVKQQEIDLNQYKKVITSFQLPKIKYSSKVLELRKNLTNLIKTRKYKQADEIKNNLKSLEQQCQQTFAIENQKKLKILVEKFFKKQSIELKALKIKLQTLFHQKIKERDQKFSILLKRNRKRKIQSSKSKLKSLKSSNYSEYRTIAVLGDSNMSRLNASIKH